MLFLMISLFLGHGEIPEVNGGKIERLFSSPLSAFSILTISIFTGVAECHMSINLIVLCPSCPIILGFKIWNPSFCFVKWDTRGFRETLGRVCCSALKLVRICGRDSSIHAWMASSGGRDGAGSTRGKSFLNALFTVWLWYKKKEFGICGLVWV